MFQPFCRVWSFYRKEDAPVKLTINISISILDKTRRKTYHKIVKVILSNCMSKYITRVNNRISVSIVKQVSRQFALCLWIYLLFLLQLITTPGFVCPKNLGIHCSGNNWEIRVILTHTEPSTSSHTAYDSLSDSLFHHRNCSQAHTMSVSTHPRPSPWARMHHKVVHHYFQSCQWLW